MFRAFFYLNKHLHERVPSRGLVCAPWESQREHPQGRRRGHRRGWRGAALGEPGREGPTGSRDSGPASRTRVPTSRTRVPAGSPGAFSPVLDLVQSVQRQILKLENTYLFWIPDSLILTRTNVFTGFSFFFLCFVDSFLS